MLDRHRPRDRLRSTGSRECGGGDSAPRRVGPDRGPQLLRRTPQRAPLISLEFLRRLSFWKNRKVNLDAYADIDQIEKHLLQRNLSSAFA